MSTKKKQSQPNSQNPSDTKQNGSASSIDTEKNRTANHYSLLEEKFYDHQRNLEKLEVIEEQMKYYHLTQTIMIGHCALLSFPRQIILSNDEENQVKLRRLDLSHNNISIIPNMLSKFSNLRELWLSYNPMTIFPPVIASLPKIEVIDIRGTSIQEIPTFIVDLTELVELDWRDTPAVTSILIDYKVEVNNLSKLIVVYRNQNIRARSKAELITFLQGDHYILDVDKPHTDVIIAQFVDELSEAFPDELDDFVRFAQRPVQFIPDQIDKVRLNSQSAKTARRLFYEMKRETDRKRLSADVEIKLRGFYFDRIERDQVTQVLDSIYEHVKSLEDMQFLVQYATSVLPSNVEDADGDCIWGNILSLQDALIVKRENSVAALATAMQQLYPEQLPELLQAKAREIASFFQKQRFATEKELLRMTQLTGEVAKVFPPDFASLVPKDVVNKAFQLIFKNL